MSRSAFRVSVILSDWDAAPGVLGRALAERLEYVTLRDRPDPKADITYFLDLSARRAPAGTLEMGWIGPGEPAPAELLQAAREIDQPVAGDTSMRDALHAAGLVHAVAIPTAVDRDRFGVKLRVGLAGPADAAGAALIAPLLDMPEIDWRAGDPGWAATGASPAGDDLLDFYRGLDHVLVPGGDASAALCRLEALAVGTPVIAPGDNRAEEPQITYAADDSADLRRVLRRLTTDRLARRAATEGRGLDAFAEAHDRLFRDLMRHRDRPRPEPAAFTRPLRLLMHGGEHRSLGGPTVRVPRTAEALRALGVPARADVFDTAREIPEDIVHLFNVWPPQSALQSLRSLRAAGKRVVFSPIYLDLAERPFWQFDLPGLGLGDARALAESYAAARSCLQGRGRLYEAVPGYHAMLREMLALADHVVFLSAAERAALAAIGARVDDSRASMIVNPVDVEAWAGGDPALFRAAHLDGLSGPAGYVLCVGRIEERKNQLLLARAMRDLPLQLVLVGHCGNPAYGARLRDEAGSHLVMPGRLDPGGEMLRSALAGAQVFALPSWSEGASLAALEAAASGASMVLSDRGAERAYFGDLAEYCDPGVPDDIRRAILRARDRQGDAGRAKALRNLLRDRHGWTGHARATANAYARTARAAERAMPGRGNPAPQSLSPPVLDITPARDAGADTRLCTLLHAALTAQQPDLQQICWSGGLGRFVTLPKRFDDLDQARRHVAALTPAQDAPEAELPEGCILVTLGDAWQDDAAYLAALGDLRQRANCGLLALVRDLGPWRAPAWYPAAQVARFGDGLRRLAALADGFVVTSQSCATDLAAVLQTFPGGKLPIARLHPGDPEPAEGAAPEGPVQRRMEGLRFVLTTGPLEARSGHGLLHRIWARFAETGQLGDLHLVIATAGVRGEEGRILAEQVARDPKVCDKVHVMMGLGAQDLSWLQARCLFTLYPSQNTGWALPVADSLIHGKLCLAGNSGAVPEIAPGLVDLIDPEDFAAWSAGIIAYSRSPAAREAREAEIADRAPRPWSDTAAQLIEIALAPRARRRQRALRTGEIAEAHAEAEPWSLGFGNGWHPADAGGRWAAESRAELSLCAASLRDGQDRLTVLLVMRAHLPGGRVRTLRATCGDDTLFAAPVSEASFPRSLLLSVPVTRLDDDGMLSLTLHLPTSPLTPQVTAEEVEGEPAPEGPRGVGLISARLLDPDLSNPLWCLPRPEIWCTGDQALVADLLDPEHRAVLAPGLAFSMAWGVGAQDGAPTLLVPVLPGLAAQTLTLSLRPIATPEAPVTATLRWNGRVLGTYFWSDDLPRTLSAALTPDDLARSGPAVLRLESSALRTPADLGLGLTTDMAGAGLTDLSLTPELIQT